jgi:hypothetical protein
VPLFAIALKLLKSYFASELLCGGNALVGSNQAAAAKVSRVLRRSAAP